MQLANEWEDRVEHLECPPKISPLHPHHGHVVCQHREPLVSCAHPLECLGRKPLRAGIVPGICRDHKQVVQDLALQVPEPLPPALHPTAGAPRREERFHQMGASLPELAALDVQVAQAVERQREPVPIPVPA